MRSKKMPALLLFAAWSALGVAVARCETLEQERSQLWGDYRSSLMRLAEDAAAAGKDKASAAVAGWLPEAGTVEIVLFDPSDVRAPELEGTIGERFAALRNRQADALFALAERAADEGLASLALRLATEAVRENPDHTEARRALGYERVAGYWLTGYEARMRDRGRVWHDRFGWIRQRDVQRYEAGLRPRGRQWVSAEQDAATRRSLEQGWIVTTEHFVITTNHSLEAGVALAESLESLHAVWSQLFADFWMMPSALANAFSGHRSRKRTRPHQVWYFRTREEYNAALRREQPRIDITLGIYFDTHRRGYFFAGEEQHPSTIVHEAVHQLFQESRRRTPRRVGRIDNFWIIEGIATYFESLAVHSDPAAGTYFTLGGAEAGRMPTARARVLQEGYYVPLAELVRLGKDDLQGRPDLKRLYSQLAGLTAFLMHAENGRFRQPLVAYLSAVYSNRAEADTLSQVTGKSYDQLDAAYQRFVRTLQ